MVKKRNAKKARGVYYKKKMSDAERREEIKRILRGEYDNWKSFGYSGGTFSGK